MEKLNYKKANVVFLINIVLSIVLSIVLHKLKVNLPAALTILLPQVLFVLPAFISLKKNGVNIKEYIHFKKVKKSTIWYTLLMFVCLEPVLNFANLISMLFAENRIEGMMSEMQGIPYLVMILLVAVLPALFEEFVYRGYFYNTYKKRNFKMAVVLSGLLFACMHMNLNQFSYTFIMGCVLAVLLESSGSIIPGMITHFVMNSLGVTIGVFALGQEVEEAATQTIPALTYVVLGVVALVGLYLVRKILKKIAVNEGRDEHMQEMVQQESSNVWSWQLVVAVCLSGVLMAIIR